jgi:hypothetical protein
VGRDWRRAAATRSLLPQRAHGLEAWPPPGRGAPWAQIPES